MSSLLNKTIVILLVLCITIHTTCALHCYTCSYLESDSDNTCLMNPSATQKTSCTKKYCTIVRQESMKPAGKVISFIRDCQDKPLFLNAVKTDFTFKTYFRSCTTDLCNDSDGKSSTTDVDPDFGSSANAIIKGKNGSGIGKIHKLLINLCVILHLIVKTL